MLSQSTTLRTLGLGWFLLLANFANGLARRMASSEPVLTIDRMGLRDRRAFDQPIFWQDIRTLCRCHPTRSRVIELYLVHPQSGTGAQKARTRFGGWLQQSFGVPAVTLNLWLIDASAADIIAAVAAFRPGLVPLGML
jgi:hypothetical protein